MSASVREFFEALRSRADASRIAGMHNSYLFQIEGAGTWTVEVADGKVATKEGATQADVTISVSADNFLKIAAGELNPTGAYMSGKLKVEGDLGAAMKLQKLF